MTFSSSLSAQRVAKTHDALEPAEYAELVNKRREALGQDPAISDEELTEVQEWGGTDWQDEIFRPGLTQKYALAASGGTPTAQYHISGNFMKDRGVLINTRYKKYGLQANLNSSVNDRLDLSLKLSGTRENHHNTDNLGAFIQGPLLSALIWPSTVPVYGEEGNYTYGLGYGPRRPFQNPVFQAAEQYADNAITTMLAVGSADLELLDGLTLTVTGSARSRDANNNNINPRRPEFAVSAARVGGTSRHSLDWQHSEVLTYDRAFNENHHLEATAVFEQQRSSTRIHGGSASGMPTIALGYNGLETGETQNTNSGFTEWSLMSYVGRVNYRFLGRYLFTGTVRVDGSSRFAEGNRYGTFPSAAFAWRVSEEPFLDGADWLDHLKFRMSWGRTGTQAIGAYATLSTLGTRNQDVSWDGEVISRGIGPTAPANPDLRWETTEQVDVGFDFSALRGRLSVTADVYQKLTHDLLLQKSVPTFLGYGSILVNQGEVRNRGVELSVTGVPVETENFTWDATVNFSANRNTVLELGDPNVDGEFVFTGNYLRGQGLAPMFMIREGDPFGLFYGLIYEGPWQEDEAEEAARYGQKPGDAHYRDLNDNGDQYDDLAVIGHGYPDYTVGLSSSMRYRDFSLNFLIHSVQGRQMFNPTRYFRVGGGPGVRMGGSAELRDHWTPENPDTDIPAFSSTSSLEAQSSYSVEDASYIRLRNVTLGYDLPRQLVRRASVRGARVYLSGQDLFTLTDYSGFDPEVNSSGANDTSQGIDMGAYPNARAYTFGIELTF